MPPIRTLIVDDEALARETIRRLLDRDPEVEVVGECAGGGEAARRATARIPAVVIVTAHDSYALRAFDAAALDYLLKPFDDERFFRTLDRAKDRVREHRVHRITWGLLAALDSAPSPGEPAYAERIAVRDDGRVRFVRVEELDWIEAADYCVRIHAGGRFHLLREPLRDLESRLDPRRFFRLHRSAIVNLARIRELEPQFHGEYVVVMQDGTRLRTSRGRRDELHQRLGLGR